MTDPALPVLLDRIDALSDAILTHAATELVIWEALSPDQAALRVAELRHEVRHTLADWRPPDDSYRAEDLPR
jgi:hypothetical protein